MVSRRPDLHDLIFLAIGFKSSLVLSQVRSSMFELSWIFWIFLIFLALKIFFNEEG